MSFGSHSRSIPILGAIPSDDDVQGSELESPFDASVINKKIVNLCSLVSQNVDIERILELAVPRRPADAAGTDGSPSKMTAAEADHRASASIPPSSVSTSPGGFSLPGDPIARGEKLSKNAKKRARRKQRKQRLASGDARAPNLPSTTNTLNISNNAMNCNHPCLSSDASSDVGSCSTAPSEATRSCRIAVARDSAFCFYYEVRY